MSQFTTPALIARETLRRLAAERRAPTPENFRDLYLSIAGNGADPDAGDETAGARELLSGVLEAGPAEALSERDDLLMEARLLARRVRAARTPDALSALAPKVEDFSLRLGQRAADARSMRDGLQRLLRSAIDNIGELIVEDRWVNAEIEVLRALLGRPPDFAMLAEAETYLAEVLLRQGALKAQLAEAKAALRGMAEGFVHQLAALSDDADQYGRSLERHAVRIRSADSLSSLGEIAAALLHDTEDLRARTGARREEWAAARAQAQAAEARIQGLEAELVRAGEALRHDQLTGALNRRGFDEAFAREASRCARSGTPLCVALIDIDNFKRLNDRYGHRAGDEALIHLVAVARAALRPADFVARHGGEEFVVLLPQTGLGEAEAAIVRLQRELTRRFFLQGNERILITFSAGLTQWVPGEALEPALARADAAQYQAKASGRNKVVRAPVPQPTS